MVLSIWVVVMAILQLRTVASSTLDGGFPAIFVFGDSLSDSGNNNKQVTVAKANYYPNGIDFPDGPTGRFCNGFTTIDHIANMMGLPLVPPFNDETTKGPKILKGVNYASGSAGILDDTGLSSGDIFTMDEQIQNFQKTIDQLRVELVKNGTNNTEEFLAKSLIVVSIGSNDFLSNYLGTTSLKPILYTVDEFVHLLLEKFRKQLKDLYILGGRRFLVTGIPPIGCIPKQVGLSNPTGCKHSTNQMAAKYNEKLEPLLMRLKEDLPGANFVYAEIFFLTLSIINNPSPYGFKNTNEACCTLEQLTNQVPCLPALPFKCQNRSEYIFWDAYHPTSTLTRIIAEHALPVVKSLLE